jgi:hypothetical protein
MREVFMIKYLDPRGSVATALEPYTLSFDLRNIDCSKIKVALLANGFPDSVLFMEKIGTALRKKFSGMDTKIWDKGNAGVAASDEMLDEIVTDCQLAIAAYGH